MDECFEILLAKALRLKATDIHFQFLERKISIFIRGFNGINKCCFDFDEYKLFNYLQYKAHLDVTSQQPQSGSFSYFYKGYYYDFRLATVISNNLKDGVLRILNCHQGLKIEQLTFQKDIQETMLNLLNKKSGLVLFAGLTSQGKTTTMYSLLKMIKNKTIYSLEDPIEVVQDNIVQLQINETIKFGYDEGIKQILRHNPDILMIGEIRDEQTAKMAIRAALTGTLVLSSLHAKSKTSAIRRLLELSCSSDDLKEVLLALFTQRLVKLKSKKQYVCIYDYLSNEQLKDYLQGKELIDQLEVIYQQAIKENIIEEQV